MKNINSCDGEMEDETVFVSIIIPVFNRKKYIGRCINSILKQVFIDFEIVIVDDGSNDGSEKICESYMSKYDKIKVIHQKNGGVSKARNTGIKHANGKYIMFIDSDDYIPTDYLYQIKKAYEKNGEDFLYCTSFKVYSLSDIRYYQYRRGTPYSIARGANLDELMNKAMFNSVCNKIYKKTLLIEYGIHFPEEIELGEDLIFNLHYLDIMKKFQFFILNKVFYEVVETKGSLERGWRENFFDIQVILLKEKIKYLNKWMDEGKIPLKAESEYRRIYFNSIRESINYYFSHKENAGLIKIMRIIVKILWFEDYYQNFKFYEKKRALLFGIKCSAVYAYIKEKIDM